MPWWGSLEAKYFFFQKFAHPTADGRESGTTSPWAEGTEGTDSMGHQGRHQTLAFWSCGGCNNITNYMPQFLLYVTCNILNDVPYMFVSVVGLILNVRICTCLFCIDILHRFNTNLLRLDPLMNHLVR